MRRRNRLLLAVLVPSFLILQLVILEYLEEEDYRYRSIIDPFSTSIRRRRRRRTKRLTSRAPKLQKNDDNEEDKNGNEEDSIANKEGQVPFDFSPSPLNPFCVVWSQNADEWWTHHPDWTVSHENSTHTCFSIMSDPKKKNYTLQLYQNQWQPSNYTPADDPASYCSSAYARQMINSGWAADFTNVAFGLIRAYEERRAPFVIYQDPRWGFWHYAANKPNGTYPACPTRDQYCYFLQIGRTCGRRRSNQDANIDLEPWTMPSKTYFHNYDVAYRYATRPQQWLRRRVWESVQAMQKIVTPPCTVLHVRRTDVVLHNQHSRRYFPVSAYVDKLDPQYLNDTLLLLTDDANAIEEAHEFYPHLKWAYFNRTRYRAAEGGWEMQVPSQNPTRETVIILTTLALVSRCRAFVHGNSKFSTTIRQAMPRKIKDASVDKGTQIFHQDNANSDRELEELLDEKRRQRSNINTN